MDKYGQDLFNKQLDRKNVLAFFANLPGCRVGLEACCGAQYWAREINKLEHTAVLISPRHVKPFVLNNKTDAADARAICEVAGRPSTRFVSVKTEEQQDLSSLHRVRERLVKNRTALVNQIRGFLSDRGIVLPMGIKHVRTRLVEIVEDVDNKLTIKARDILSDLYTELHELDDRLAVQDRKLQAATKNNQHCVRLMKIPGIGPITASAIVAHVGDAKQFKNGRELAAYFGLTPREHSSGGKQKLLGISKRGDTYIRKLLIQGVRNLCRVWIRAQDVANDHRKAWLQGVVDRRGKFVASVAQANKTARIVWAVLA